MKSKDEILQHIENDKIFKERLEDVNDILARLDGSKWRFIQDNITKYSVDKYRGEDYIFYSTDDRYYCGGYENDDGEFPLRYLWMEEKDIQIEVIEDKDRRMKKQFEEALERNKIKEQEEKEQELKLLKELKLKYGDIE